MGRPRLAILVPTLNEEAGLAATLEAIPRRELERHYDVELWIVDGNSTDGTVAVARRHGVKVILQKSRGKGAGLREAFAAIECDYLAMLDGDGTYPAEALPQLVAALDQGADVVQGWRSRMEPGAMSGVHRVGNVLLSAWASLLYTRLVRDVCTGMMAFRKPALDRLDLHSQGFDVEAEIFARARRLGLRLVGIPIAYRRRLGRSKLGGVTTGLRIGAALVRERVRPKGAV